MKIILKLFDYTFQQFKDCLKPEKSLSWDINRLYHSDEKIAATITTTAPIREKVPRGSQAKQEVFTLAGAAAEATALHTTASFAQLRYMGVIWNVTAVPWESQHQNYDPVITNNDQHHLVFDVLPPLQHQQQQFLPTAKVESNFLQTCKKNLAQLRLCNPSSCSKWTRSLPVVGGR